MKVTIIRVAIRLTPQSAMRVTVRVALRVALRVAIGGLV